MMLYTDNRQAHFFRCAHRIVSRVHITCYGLRGGFKQRLHAGYRFFECFGCAHVSHVAYIC